MSAFLHDALQDVSIVAVLLFQKEIYMLKWSVIGPLSLSFNNRVVKTKSHNKPTPFCSLLSLQIPDSFPLAEFFLSVNSMLQT